jgi:hypothetical protein
MVIVIVIASRAVPDFRVASAAAAITCFGEAERGAGTETAAPEPQPAAVTASAIRRVAGRRSTLSS